MYTVYILKCADDTFYTGITNDLEKRIHEHSTAPAGAKYTRGRRPVTLAYSEKADTRSEALQREAAIKKLSRREKLQLMDEAK